MSRNRIDGPGNGLRGPNFPTDDIEGRIVDRQAMEDEADRFVSRVVELLAEYHKTPDVQIGEEIRGNQVAPPHAGSFEDVIAILELAVRRVPEQHKDQLQCIADQIARRWPVEHKSLPAKDIAQLFARRGYILRSAQLETDPEVLLEIQRVTLQYMQTLTKNVDVSEMNRLIVEVIGPVTHRLSEIALEARGEVRAAVSAMELQNQDHRQVVDALKQEASLDGTTQLLRKQYFVHEVERVMNGEEPEFEQAVTCFIDLNGMKQGNDAFGHHGVDVLLKHIGTALSEHLEELNTDETRVVIGRLGGDEFGVTLLGASKDDEELITQLGEVCKNAFTAARKAADEELENDPEHGFSNSNIDSKISDASFGFVEVEKDEHGQVCIEEDLKRADKLMEEAKGYKRIMNYPARFEGDAEIWSLSGEILPQDEWEAAFAAAKQEAAADDRLQ